MCRYAFSGPYKDRYACFDCRKAFKRRKDSDLPRQMKQNAVTSQVVLCPECGQPMQNMGMDFKAPRRDDVRQWKKVQLLVANGFTFGGCGCGPGLRPSKLNEVHAFLDDKMSKSDGEELLKKFASHGRERERYKRKRLCRAARKPNTGRLWGPVQVVPLRSILERKPKQRLTQLTQPARKRA